MRMPELHEQTITFAQFFFSKLTFESKPWEHKDCPHSTMTQCLKVLKTYLTDLTFKATCQVNRLFTNLIFTWSTVNQVAFYCAIFHWVHWFLYLDLSVVRKKLGYVWVNVRASEMASFEGLINNWRTGVKILTVCVCGFPFLLEF